MRAIHRVHEQPWLTRNLAFVQNERERTPTCFHPHNPVTCPTIPFHERCAALNGRARVSLAHECASYSSPHWSTHPGLPVAVCARVFLLPLRPASGTFAAAHTYESGRNVL